MKNSDEWRPSKFVRKHGRLTSSSSTEEVSISSRLSVDAVARHYDAHLAQYTRGRLLDLGCGKVPLFEEYREFVTENVCVDWGNSLHHNKFVDFECDLSQELPFPDSAFDTILLSDVLEHIADPALLWREMARVLAGDGRIIMNVPFFYWLHERPHDYYRYTEFALRRFAELSGLTVVYLTPVGGTPEILADICAKSLVRIPGFGAPLAILIQSIAGAFIRTTWGKRVSSRSAVDFPLGYFLVAQKDLKR